MSLSYNASTVEYSDYDFTYTGFGVNNLANLPVLGVFIAFDSGVYDADPDWVEITQYVRSVQISRGRVDELEPFQGGKASVVLDNRTRLFDPFNTAGLYYGKLLPRKQIKIVALEDSVTYGLFRGFVSGFPVEWTEAGKDSTVTVDCFDLLALLGAEVVSTDLAADAINALSPVAFIKNDVKQNTVVQQNAGGITQFSSQPNYGTIGGTSLITEVITTTGSNAGSGSVNPAENIMDLTVSPSLAITGSNLASVDVGRDLIIGQTGASAPVSTMFYTVVFWVKIDPTTDATINWSGADNVAELMHIDYVFEDSGTYDRICLNLNSSLAPVGSISIFTYGSVYASSFQAINDGKPHCIAVTFYYTSDFRGRRKIYIDGVDTTVTSLDSGFVSPIKRARLLTQGSTQSIQFGYSAIFYDVLTDQEIATLAAYGNNDFPEPADDRFNRLISLSNIPAAWTSTTGTFEYQTVQDFPKVGTQLLPALQQLATSEGGQLFVDGDGVLNFWARDAIYGEYPASLITLADDGSGFPYANRSVRVMLDGDAIRNDVTVVDALERTVNVRDDASIQANGTSAETINTILVDVDAAQNLAERTVTIFSDPDLDLEPLVLQGQYDPNYWQDILNTTELLRKFTFKRTPSVGSQISRQMLVQQINWNITPSTWEVSIKGSARFTGWFTVGLSQVGGSDVIL